MQQKVFKMRYEAGVFDYISYEDKNAKIFSLEELNNQGYTLIIMNTDSDIAIFNFNSSDKKLGAAGL